MKFNCGLSALEKAKVRYHKQKEKWHSISHWHPVFAWFPTRVGPHDCRWLEYVARINLRYAPNDPDDWTFNLYCELGPRWEYRALK